MNRKLQLLLISIILVATNVSSQKYDFNWLIGYSSIPKKDSVEGHTMLNFNTNSGQLEFKFDKNKNIEFFGGNALSFSDKDGYYLMSFNGFLIEDGFGNKVINSDSICYFDECWILEQSSIFIPDIENPNEYFLITVHLNDFDVNGGKLSFINLKKTSDNHLILNSERKILIVDTLNPGQLTACKHANGRDWWILAFEDSLNIYYNILIDKNGPKVIGKNRVNGLSKTDGSGYACFSNNGKYYMTYLSDSEVFLPYRIFDFYEFDRCTGTLFNHQRRIYPYLKYDGEGSDVSCAFSPDSKLLYICESDSLFQFPISEDGILGERVLIDVYDGYQSHLFGPNFAPTKFRQLQLAPDGKIYCNPTWLQTREYGVINKPNNPGKACDFRQHSLRMPALKYTSPSFPNYRLGPIDGSSCDTLGIDNIPWCWWRYDQDTSKPLCFEFTDLSAYEVAEWYWDFGDGTQNRDTSPFHCFPKNGVYKVCLIVKNQNGADTLCRTLNIGITGTHNNEYKDIQTELFPNPASDYFVLNIPDYIPEHMMLNLINAQGELVLSQRVFQGSNVIELLEIPSGLYLLQLKDQNGLMKTEKLVIE